MLRRSERGAKRLDYEVFNEIGDRVEKSDPSSTTSPTTELVAKLDELSISSSFKDVAKESPLSSSSAAQDVVVDDKLSSSSSICSASDTVDSVEGESLSDSYNSRDYLSVSGSPTDGFEAIDQTSTSISSTTDRIAQYESLISNTNKPPSNPPIQKVRSSSCLLIKRDTASIRRSKTVTNLVIDTENNTSTFNTLTLDTSTLNTSTLNTSILNTSTLNTEADLEVTSPSNNNVQTPIEVSTPVDSVTVEGSVVVMAETADQLAIQESTISDDIDDYVSENPIEDDASSYMDMYELEKSHVLKNSEHHSA